MTANNAGAILTIDLDAIAANYALLRDRVQGAVCAAVVKADAYGLGLSPVGRRLAKEGCRNFFVAQLDEAIALRQALADMAADASIFVLNGLVPGAEEEYSAHRVVPVLNSPGEIEAWSAYAQRLNKEQPAILQLDTGMSRLGLTASDTDVLARNPDRLAGIDLKYIMSHLACAGSRTHPMNAEQHRIFGDALATLPDAPASLANSSGIFLGPRFHHQMVRPGAAIYGLIPVANESNPMSQAIELKGKILQIRVIDTGQAVGYGATHCVTRKSRIATVAVGYGDGYFRTLGNRGCGYLGEYRVPVVGRVSMDLTTFDVTDVPEQACQPGMTLSLINEKHTVDDVAAAAQTIGYEILTNLGRRYFRTYLGAA
ncbi:MAG: alanine racemase [Rhodospirillaceae bacterium]|jgi:alanine racemase|nr:alanine racemase [Rhodospirillaceae bacterium]MBT5459423.1 alanine racemase [Rhodospirillaceae bacterium]